MRVETRATIIVTPQERDTILSLKEAIKEYCGAHESCSKCAFDGCCSNTVNAIDIFEALLSEIQVSS